MRDHEAIVIEDFNGLFQRGGADSCPRDHFSDCNNIQYIQSGFKTRYGIDPYLPYGNIVRMYTFVKEPNIESLLILNNEGNLFCTSSPTPFIPILHIDEMVDFAYVPIAGRAYISPHNGATGISNEFLYVYSAGHATARKAAGLAPAGGAFSAADDGSGNVEAGYHIFALVYETDTGFLTALGDFFALNSAGDKIVDLTGISVSSDPAVKKVHIVATKAVNPTEYTGNLQGYQFFFIPGAIVDNGTTTLSVSFFDAELLSDANHLIDNFAEIPAMVSLTTYHGRLIGTTESSNISLARVSFPGEPEAISQVSGLILAAPDGNPLTNAQEFRDILYLFKATRTIGYADNNDVPSSWQPIVVDQGIGASVHGIATVLDSGGVNIDVLIVVDYSGVMLFTGLYQRPELSWKIQDLWLALDRNFFYKMQIINDSIKQRLYIILPNHQMLMGDYSNGMDFKSIRWTPWTFTINTNTITLIDKNVLLIGSSKD